MKAMKLIKILTILNFFGLIIVFVACRTGAFDEIKKNKTKSEDKKEINKKEVLIDEAELEDFFYTHLTIADGSKSGVVIEKEDVFYFNYFVENIIEYNLKLIAKGKTKPKIEHENKKNNKDVLPSSKSAKIILPKQEK